MDTFYNLLVQTLFKVALTFSHNWPFLVVSVFISVTLKLYVDPQKVSRFLLHHRRGGVIGATIAAVGTPLCSCGTTAIILGMMASMMPWSPIVAFMVASPLTSPEELIYSAGLFGWPFALAFFASSFVLGLAGGAAAGFMENRGWLTDQVRLAMPETRHEPIAMKPNVSKACGCNVNQTKPATTTQLIALSAVDMASSTYGYNSSTTEIAIELPAKQSENQLSASTCSCESAPQTGNDQDNANPGVSRTGVTPGMFLYEIVTTGKRLLIMFAGFAFIGYFLNGLIPSTWISTIFGEGNIYSVLLAATLGLPLYINTEGSLPLVKTLIEGGMSHGAALAFLITGAGTSFGAIAGMLTIARWRVISLVIGTLWIGSIVLGHLYNFLLAIHLI